MGLCISIVSTVKEKVWFHSCGKKNCYNSQLKEKGGCAIWYNEPEYWPAIQHRMQMTIVNLDENFKLPSSHEGSDVLYGQKKQNNETQQFSEHSHQIKPLVIQLAQLEDQSQLNFFSLRSKWNNKFGVQNTPNVNFVDQSKRQRKK